MDNESLILHIDDDEPNRYAVTRSLTKAGFMVVEGGSGADALRLAEKNPELIILDVRLPDMNGFEVCKKLKADPRTSRIPVLHLSASYTSSDDKALGLDSGADAYLVRPVEPAELLATVRALLRTRRIEDELRLSEDRYRQVVENVQDFAIFTTDQNSLIRTWNIGAQRMIGYTEEQIIGKSAEIIFTPEDRAAGVPQREFGRAAKDGRAPDDRWHLRADGRRFFANGVVTAMHDVSGKLIGFSKLMQDVTARLLAQQELQTSKEIAERAKATAEEAQANAEQANRLKDDFLATLSHELRTPLNAIVGWTQLLRAPATTPDDLAEGLETIERNAKVQTQIIEDLLDISRIISGKLRLDVQRIELNGVVASAINSVSPAAEAKGIELKQTPATSPIVVLGDSSRLQQVLWNLLTNAIKFTPRDGRVTVSLTREHGEARIVVTDTGIGISPNFLPHVFDRFRQADATTRRNQAGLGLGLAIVKQLVELHGGSVTATSEGTERGSQFTVTLPLPTARFEPPADLPLPEGKGLLDRKTHLVGLSVLLVEDDRDSRLLLRRILSDSGARVVAAADAAEAIRQFDEAQKSTQRFDVIVSDIGMPVQDGYDLIASIRQRGVDAGGSVPAIALTAFVRPEDRVKALAAGFQSHIAKPANPDELIAAIAHFAAQTREP